MPPSRPAIERFMEKVDRNDATGCWEWMANRISTGYGMFHIGYDGRKKKSGLAHRWIYERVVGEIPDGLTVDHLCNNRGCVNPDHLELVTHAENCRRAADRRTHCANGHEWTAENTYSTSHQRFCRRCVAVRSKRWRDARKALIPAEALA